MFEITVRKTFKARHALSNYRGGREDPHEHEFACEVAIAGANLDPSGCVVDFVQVDEVLGKILATFASQALGSAENIAEHVYKEISASITALKRVTVWEDENHSASYFETSELRV